MLPDKVTLELAFGDDTMGTKGVVITDGSLTSLDASLSANEIDLKAGVKLMNPMVTVGYDSSTSAYTIGGGATLELPDPEESSGYTSVGATLTIGLQGGTLTQFDLKLDNDKTFTLHGLTIAPKSLEFSYDYDPNTGETLKASGDVSIEFMPDKGDSGGDSSSPVSIEVALGDDTHDGIVITNGTLTSLYAVVTADFKIKGLDINIDKVTVDYEQSDDSFVIDGSMKVSLGNNEVTATLGDGTDANHGIVVQGGSLQSVYIGVEGSFEVYGLTLKATNVIIAYSAADHALELSGGVSVQLGDEFKIAAAIGSDAPLEIDTNTGSFTFPKGVDITGSLEIGMIGADVSIKYDHNSDDTYNLDVTATVHLPQDIDVQGTLSIVNSQLSSIALSYDAGMGQGIAIGATGLFLTHLGGEVDNINDPAHVSVSGSIEVKLGKTITIGGTAYSIVDATGSFLVDANHLHIDGSVTLVGGYLGEGSASVDVNWQTGVFEISVPHIGLFDDTLNFSGEFMFDSIGDITLNAEADIRVPKDLPLIGGITLLSGNFYLQIRPTLGFDQNFVAAYTDLPIIGDVGFELELDGTFFLIGGPPTTTPAPAAAIRHPPLSDRTALLSLLVHLALHACRRREQL